MSALLNFDPQNSKIIIEAHFVFYGKYAQDELAKKIIEEINSFWNAPQTKISIENVVFAVNFNVDFECVSVFEVKQMLLSNENYRNIFIRIEDKNGSERSMMGFGMGENSGHWLITDNLGESTTAAHEFGHALGLPHPSRLDYRNDGIPPIMAPRGTIVDAEYQWNPTAEAGAFGGTMKPIHRRVSSDEIMAVLRPFDLRDLQPKNIGKLSNFFFDEIGQVVV